MPSRVRRATPARARPRRARGPKALRVGILESGDRALAHGEKRDGVAVLAARGAVEAVEAACRARGWEPARITASADPRRTRAALERARPDVVFHLAESVEGDARVESLLAALLDGLEIAYTGSGPATLWAALHKPIARSKLAAAGILVPQGFALETAQGPLPRAFRRDPRARWIVKPSREDASHGIALESVVTGEKALRERARFVIGTYAQPALVEEFVEGREFNVSILEEENGRRRVLPLAEIDFARFPAGAPKLVTFASKWIEGSDEHAGTPSIAVEKLAPALGRAIRRTALACWKALGLRGYGRVDMRIAKDGTPRVLDVNPNPDISPDAGLARAAERGGIDHEDLVARIVESGLRRARARPAPAVAR